MKVAACCCTVIGDGPDMARVRAEAGPNASVGMLRTLALT
jgi:hypothetical protein